MNIPAGVKRDIVAGREQRALRGDIPARDNMKVITGHECGAHIGGTAV